MRGSRQDAASSNTDSSSCAMWSIRPLHAAQLPDSGLGPEHEGGLGAPACGAAHYKILSPERDGRHEVSLFAHVIGSPKCFRI